MSVFKVSSTTAIPVLKHPEAQAVLAQKPAPSGLDGFTRGVVGNDIRVMQPTHVAGPNTLGAMTTPDATKRLMPPLAMQAPPPACQGARQAGYTKEQKDILLTALFTSHRSSTLWSSDEMSEIARVLNQLIEEGMVLEYDDAAPRFAAQATMHAARGNFNTTRYALSLRDRFGGTTGNVNADKDVLLNAIFRVDDPWQGHYMQSMAKQLDTLISEGLILTYEDVAAKFMRQASIQSRLGKFDDAKMAVNLANKYTPHCC